MVQCGYPAQQNHPEGANPMTQPTTQAQPNPVPVPSSEDLARAQLIGVLEALKA